MQPETITLLVNEDNDNGTTPEVSHVFSKFDISSAGRSIYVSAVHTTANRDTLSLYRSLPKVNGNFKGTTKTSAKFTLDVQVPGVDGETTLTIPQIIEVSFSNPVGLTPAQTLALRMRVAALIVRNDIMAPLCDVGLV